MSSKLQLLSDISTFIIGSSRYIKHINLERSKENIFGGSLTRDTFSSKYGALIIKAIVNSEVKIRGGPIQGGYSADLDTTNIFVKKASY